MSTGIPYVLGTDAYHGYLYREVGYAVELGSDIITDLKVLPPMLQKYVVSVILSEVLKKAIPQIS